MRMFSIGLNKSWVEVRVAEATPEAKKSRVVREFDVPKSVYNEYTGLYGGRRKLVLEVTCFEGGKVLTTIPRHVYLALMRKLGDEAPRTGAMKELSLPIVKLFSNPEWREQNHV